MSDREQDRVPRATRIPLAVAVYLISDNLSLREAWRAANDA